MARVGKARKDPRRVLHCRIWLYDNNINDICNSAEFAGEVEPREGSADNDDTATRIVH